MMERLIFTLTPKTAFATPLAGDTLVRAKLLGATALFRCSKINRIVSRLY